MHPPQHSPLILLSDSEDSNETIELLSNESVVYDLLSDGTSDNSNFSYDTNSSSTIDLMSEPIVISRGTHPPPDGTRGDPLPSLRAGRGIDTVASSNPTSILTEVFPRVSQDLILATARQAHLAYSGEPPAPSPIADRVRLLRFTELDYLRMRAGRLLAAEIPDPLLVCGLIDLVTKREHLFVSSLFRDLLNVDRSHCGICYEDFKPEHRCTSLHCLHTFHARCINRWVKVSWCCPLCRSKEI